MTPIFFAKPSDLRKWFLKNHTTEKELLVGFHKVHTAKPSVSWPESVDEALCFGWIDGVRKSIDEYSYSIRFTPRKPKSIWSAINIDKIEVLKTRGLMLPAGTAIYEKRTEAKSRIYAYETEVIKLALAYEKKLKSNKKAWAYFQKAAPSYKKLAVYRIMSAKQEATRTARLDALICACEAGNKFW